MCLLFSPVLYIKWTQTSPKLKKAKVIQKFMSVIPKHCILYSCPSEAVLVSNKLTLRRCNRKIQLDSSFRKHSSSNSPPKFLKLCLILSPYLWLPFFLFTAYMIRNILSFFSKVIALPRPLTEFCMTIPVSSRFSGPLMLL